jgi:putative ABC transport system ATP-binding protein
MSIPDRADVSVAPPAEPGGEASGAQVKIRGVAHAYGRGTVPVLHDLDLDVERGEFLALTGPSGAGKSTLLSLVGGLEPLQSGSIVVAGHDLSSLSGDALADYRRSTVGFVFQHYGLVEVLTARENVELSLALSRTSPAERRVRAERLLEGVGLSHRVGHRPAELSGGERQRVAIARALANGPRLLLADEPTGNLDDETTMQVLGLLGEVHAETGCTLIVVTHERRVAERAGSVRRLRAGRWAVA